MPRPEPTEYDPYYGRYVQLVPDGEVLETLEREMHTTQDLLAAVPAAKETYRYAPGKWSLRDVVGHLVDVERAFAWRCLWIARAAPGSLPSFEQDEWADVSNAGRRPLAELAEEWKALRRDNVLLFAGLDDEAMARTGIASGKAFTARTFPWIIAGHEIYHRRLLQRDYLGGEA